MTRTYLDAGVLIVAARGHDQGARKAFTILNDNTRTFAASVFLQLGVDHNRAPRETNSSGIGY